MEPGTNEPNGSPPSPSARPRSPRRQSLAVAGALLALAVMGVLVARAAPGGGGLPTVPGHAFVAGAPLVPTDTPIPPPPTATPVPPPPPTATSVPPSPITFACAGAAATETAGYYRGRICVHADGAPGADVHIDVTYCGAATFSDSINLILDANGDRTTDWVFHPACAAPVAVRLDATGTGGAGGGSLAGIVSFQTA